MVQTQFSTSIKIFRSDSGGEYLSHDFRRFLTDQGTLPQVSCPGAHDQNGVAERKHRHIIETARTLLLASHVPKHFWTKAVSTAVYLINLQPYSFLKGISPGESLFPRHLVMIIFMFVVARILFFFLLMNRLSVECIFLGYSL